MPDQALAIETKPLSQTERVVDTFVAPSKTFTDILRNASWWVPFLLLIICGYVLTAAIQTKVGWPQLIENEIRAQPKLSERLDTLSPEQREKQRVGMTYGYKVPFYGLPVTNLIFISLFALVLWATINFGFGGSATFGRTFAMTMYASLPGAIKAILAAALLFAGRSADSFTAESMIGSDLGYYIESPGPLRTLLSQVDLFAIWTAVLLSIGLAIVARTKQRNGYIAVFGWWILATLVRVGIVAATS